MSISLCCCGSSNYTALKFGIALHHRYGEAVFERNNCIAAQTGGVADGTKRYRAIGRRFRRVLMSSTVEHHFPSPFAGQPPGEWTVTASDRSTYNRYTGVREDVIVQPGYPYFRSTRGLWVYPPYSFWELQTQTNSVTSNETSVTEVAELRFASYRGEGFMRVTLRHDFEDEATQAQAIEDVGLLLDHIDLQEQPWNFPDPALTRIPGHIYSSTYFTRFTSSRGDIAFSGDSPTINGYTIPGRTRYLDRPIQSPDTGKTGLVPDLWAGVCFNPNNQLTTEPVGDNELLQLGSVLAVKALMVTRTGTYYGNVVGSRIGAYLGPDACAALAGAGTPLLIGATPNDLERYPDVNHIHDWADMVRQPGFLQVSREPCT